MMRTMMIMMDAQLTVRDNWGKLASSSILVSLN